MAYENQRKAKITVQRATWRHDARSSTERGHAERVFTGIPQRQTLADILESFAQDISKILGVGCFFVANGYALSVIGALGYP